MKQRKLCALLAVLMAFTAGCGTTADISGDSTTADTTTEPEIVYPNYGGRTVTFLVREDNIESEFYVGESTGDIIDDALYDRKKTLDERYNVGIEFAYVPGHFWDDRDQFVNAVQTSVMSNDGAYDIIGGVSVVMPTLMMNDLPCDISKVDEIKLDEPWWTASLMDELSINGKLYFASGDASLGMISGMMCMFFNKTLIDELKMEDPYELVTSGKWTFDKLLTMAEAGYSDINGNGKVDEGDRYGLTITNRNHVNNFLDSFDLHIIQRDTSGLPYFTFGDEKVVEAMDKLNSALNNLPGFVVENENGTLYTNTFRDGNALFASAEFKDSINLRDVTSDFGIIPYPKWDETQDEYHGAARSTFTLFGLPTTADASVAGTILEAFAKESYEKVSPAYYEIALKVKYSRDDISAQMYDLIRGGVRFQFGITYSGVLDDVSTYFKGQVENGNWASFWASKKSGCEERLKELLEKMV